MARSFNGSSDKIIVTSNSIFDLTVGTIGGWVNTSLAPAGLNIFVHGRADGQNKSGIDFLLGVTSAQLLVSAWDISGTQQFVKVAGPSINDGNWHHLGCVFSTANGATGTIYVDGTSQGSATNSGSWAFNGENLQFGIAAAASWRNFNGSMADWFWSSAQFTSGEMSALGQGARPYNFRSIVGYWPFGGLQSPEPDLSGNANNGTLTGTANASGPPIMQFTPRWGRFVGWTPMLPASGLGWIINRRNKLMVPKKRA